MAEMALAAAVNLPKLTEQLLAQDAETGSSSDDSDGGSSSSSLLQQNKSSLLSAAAAVAAAATAFVGAVQQQEEGQFGSSSTSSGAGSAAVAAAGVAPTSALDVQALLEEEVNAMNCLLDGRWVFEGPACATVCSLPP